MPAIANARKGHKDAEKQQWQAVKKATFPEWVEDSELNLNQHITQLVETMEELSPGAQANLITLLEDMADTLRKVAHGQQEILKRMVS